jgi:hypothetical protein
MHGSFPTEEQNPSQEWGMSVATRLTVIEEDDNTVLGAMKLK